MFVKNLGNIGLTPGLDEKSATQRKLLVYQGALMAVGGLVWGGLCFGFGLVLPAAVPFGYTLVTILNFAYLYGTKNFAAVRFIQVLISLLLPVIFQVFLGGFNVSGAVTLWSLLSLVSSITFQSIRSAVIWTGAYLLMIVGLGLSDGRTPPQIPAEFAPLLFTLNIALISAMVVALIIYFVWSRDRANEELEEARRETETILNEVQEGLLLLGPDGKVSTGHSESAAALLQKPELVGLDFPEFIGSVTESKTETIADYLDLMFTRSLPAKKIAFLNPLVRVKTRLVRAEQQDSLVLDFKFRPIADSEKKIQKIFVTITDVSEEIKLERAIKVQQEESRKRIELISQILYSRPELVETFLNDTREDLATLDQYLNANEHGADFAEVLRRMYRTVHGIKGNAGLIKLTYFATLCHQMEEKLEGLQKRGDLSGTDLIEPIGELDTLRQACGDLSEQFEVLQNFGSRENDAPAPEATSMDTLRENLETIIREVAADEGKQVELRLSGSVDGERISLKTLRTLLAQLTRNSVAHGIEAPDRRAEQGKPAAGRIEIELKPGAQGLDVRVTDDGAGIDPERIRQKLAEQGHAVDALSEKELLQSIFRPGFSTRQQADQNAGRGVGLDIVMEEIKRSGGTLKIKNRPGQGTSFQFSLGSV